MHSTNISSYSSLPCYNAYTSNDSAVWFGFVDRRKVGASPTMGTSRPHKRADNEAVSTISTASSLSGSLDPVPDELLRRARSKLVVQIETSIQNMATKTNIQKVVLPLLPHTLEAYKSIYNKNGRIGIYAPLERAAIIAKFNAKRRRRVWNKKIRYSYRKDMADLRTRVKGRFAKRPAEQQAAVVEPAKNKQTSASSTKTITPALSDDPITVPINIPINETKETSCVVSEGDDVDILDVNNPGEGSMSTDDTEDMCIICWMGGICEIHL